MSVFEMYTEEVLSLLEEFAKGYNIEFCDLCVYLYPFITHTEGLDDEDIPYDLSGWTLILGKIQCGDDIKNFAIKGIHSAELCTIKIDYSIRETAEKTVEKLLSSLSRRYHKCTSMT